ncbi:hypothetical protein OIE69_44125 (plasmid) [Actinacidiphila glaucinigra]|uniref:hypothetical protein n=1 Tax=Actinacidiphila glaucinigra TaxID=235986 RepID=UPI002DDA1761|nr:hypothetical protein [Actinacidiphila glaucinigra]WSD65893.1 hypothetical protein OIE69_44125 [Actinacidiphila glaucinigra]
MRTGHNRQPDLWRLGGTPAPGTTMEGRLVPEMTPQRLYALTSITTHPWGDDTPGPKMLIRDPLVATQWYLRIESEEVYAVSAQVSDDQGATWRPLLPSELLQDAHRHLSDALAGQRDSRRALVAEAAAWLDRRMRFVQPDDPVQWIPSRPSVQGWRTGGDVWAMAMGTVPNDDVLSHLAATYSHRHTVGAKLVRRGARKILAALALGQNPSAGGSDVLLRAWRVLHRAATHVEAGQVNASARAGQDRILAHLATHHPERAADVAKLRVLRPVAGVDEAGDPPVRNRAAQNGAAGGQAAGTVEPGEAVMPGYPKAFPDDLQAAAAWRQLSPKAARAADLAMDDLSRASHQLNRLTHPETGMAPQEDLTEDGARGWFNACCVHLAELDAEHAMLMYAHLLASARDEAKPALHRLGVAAAEATAGLGVDEGNRQFSERLRAIETGIDETVAAQAQLARNALHRCIPQIKPTIGWRSLLEQRLIRKPGLGPDAFEMTWRTLRRFENDLDVLTRRAQAKREGDLVTPEQLQDAQSRVTRLRGDVAALRTSMPTTRRALKALQDVMELAPTDTFSVAARLSKIIADSQKRAADAPPAHDPMPSTSHSASTQRTHQQQGSAGRSVR